VRFIRVPEHVAEAARKRAEKTRIRKAKYDANVGRTNHHARDGTRTDRIPLAEREFIVWDGEGPQDTAYSLFGNSKGMEICYPTLSTSDCLAFIVEAGKRYPGAIHTSFGFMYDISNILKDLSWRHFGALLKFNRTVWKDYEIEVIPHKWFKVKQGNVSVKIYDVHSFFASSLVGALEKWKIGPFADSIGKNIVNSTAPMVQVVPSLDTVCGMDEQSLVRLFKNLRSEFLWKDIEQIRVYMRLELKYTKILMEALRDVFIDAGYLPRSWHGPGSLARMAFTRHNIYANMAVCPSEVRIAARYGFFGGRFELFAAGHIDGTVYGADLNSAYPFFCSQLPNLANGEWHYTKTFVAGSFGIYNVRYDAPAERYHVETKTGIHDPYAIHPLPYRDKHGMVSWPNRVEGWYWTPETEIALETGHAQILEGWYFEEANSDDKPFAWILEYYHRRKLLKKLGNPAEYTFKLILNSIYGQLAQRTGWDRKTHTPPRTHQLEWAGYITSACRAAVYRAAMQNPDAVISIDTDGVFSTMPFRDLQWGDELGEWEYTEYEDGVFWQSGIYGLKKGSCVLNEQCSLQWSKAKTRGIPRGTYSVADLLDRVESRESLQLTKKVFIGYGLARIGNREKINTWTSEPHNFVFGGGGKRYFPKRGVKRAGNLYRLALPFASYGIGMLYSVQHSLPWINPENEWAERPLANALVLFDRNDRDDDWYIDYEFETHR
jgi:hypothetical protein